MNHFTSSRLTRFFVSTSLAAVLAACSSAPADEPVGESADAIVNGTATFLGQNSFVRLPGPQCTGTLIDNQWVLTANHCTSHVGDAVYLDSQVRNVARVVPHPDVIYGVDIALLKLDSPMTVAGTTNAFRRTLRSTIAPPGTHVRCFGYGQTSGAPGITTQLTRMELGTTGGANNNYFFERNALLQSAGPGDSGGGCLDDNGALIAVMRSMTWAPTSPGETAGITSAYYAGWASTVMATCSSSSDCLTGICNATKHRCVSSTCEDGVRDNGETGIDCGGPCAAECRHCPLGMLDCGDGHCVKHGFQCP